MREKLADLVLFIDRERLEREDDIVHEASRVLDGALGDAEADFSSLIDAVRDEDNDTDQLLDSVEVVSFEAVCGVPLSVPDARLLNEIVSCAEMLPASERDAPEDVLDCVRVVDIQQPLMTEHGADITMAPEAKVDASIFVDVCHEHPV